MGGRDGFWFLGFLVSGFMGGIYCTDVSSLLFENKLKEDFLD
jgi:hypothetical protein